MIPKHESITLPKQKRRTYRLERLSMRERALRHGHHHDRKMVLSFVPFVNLTTYGYICYLLFTDVADHLLDIDSVDGFAKPMRELHLKP
jgi:hypothetical protein